jgi:transcriptional antiterminator
MQGERLLSIILLLQTREVLNAKELADKLEVSVRTIYRDIDALSLSGIPIYSIRGSQGGFSLDKNFRVNLTGLSHAELKELFINRIPGPLADLGLGSKFDRVIDKNDYPFCSEHPFLGTVV